MKNTDIAKVFQDIADLLELKEESPFKVRAYQRGARSINQLPVQVDQLIKEGRLKEVPCIGEAISKKIVELVTTGRLEYYENLRAEFPEGISTLLDIPGIGPKTALQLTQELGIRSADELEIAIIDGRVANLPHLGGKAAQNILHRLRRDRAKEKKPSIGVVLPFVEDMMTSLRERTNVNNLTPTGDARRFSDTVGAVTLLGSATDSKSVIEVFAGLPQVREVISQCDTSASVVTLNDLQVNLCIVDSNVFGSYLQHHTGSEQHNILLSNKARDRGFDLRSDGIADLGTGRLDRFSTEEKFYRFLDMEFIPPELREGRDEIEKAQRGMLPRLLELSDIKGDLHVHTNWSDGKNSIEEMAREAQSLGYQYLAITDHSAGRGIAHGLNPERVAQQIKEIERLNKTLDGIHILSGIEVDIRADGTLDLPDDILSQLDVVIAAIHSGLQQDKEKITQRIICALENYHVDVLAHPTCRLLGERDPVDADWEAIFRAASRTGTILEINSMPSRLDLKDIHIFRARELGVKLVIDTDSHTVGHLGLMRFGIGTARRGWCEAKNVLNTESLDRVQDFFKQPRYARRCL